MFLINVTDIRFYNVYFVIRAVLIWQKKQLENGMKNNSRNCSTATLHTA